MNYHVLDSDPKFIRVAFHIPVPDDGGVTEKNVASKTWRACVVEDGGIIKTSVVPGIQAAEQTQLTNGELIEVVTTVRQLAGATNLAKQAAVDAAYNVAKAAEIAKLKQRYWAWGFARNVP